MKSSISRFAPNKKLESIKKINYDSIQKEIINKVDKIIKSFTRKHSNSTLSLLNHHLRNYVNPFSLKVTKILLDQMLGKVINNTNEIINEYKEVIYVLTKIEGVNDKKQFLTELAKNDSISNSNNIFHKILK